MTSQTWARVRRYGLGGGTAITALGLALNLLNAAGHDLIWYQEHLGLVYLVVLGVVAIVPFVVGYLANPPMEAGRALAFAGLLAGALAGLISLLGYLLIMAVTLSLQDSSSPLGLLGAIVYVGMLLIMPLVLGGGVLGILGAFLSDLQYRLTHRQA